MAQLTTVAVIATAILSLPLTVPAAAQNQPNGGKITQFPTATLPLGAADVCYVVQNGVSKQFLCLSGTSGGPTGVTSLTAGCDIAMSSNPIVTSGTIGLNTFPRGLVGYFGTVDPVGCPGDVFVGTNLTLDNSGNLALDQVVVNVTLNASTLGLNTGDTIAIVSPISLGSQKGNAGDRLVSGGGAAAPTWEPPKIPQHEAIWQADSNTIVQEGTSSILTLGTINGVVYPWNSATIEGILAKTNGTNTPSFDVTLFINGTSVVGCGLVNVFTPTLNPTACTSANTITATLPPSELTMVVSSISGTPDIAAVYFMFSTPPP